MNRFLLLVFVMLSVVCSAQQPLRPAIRVIACADVYRSGYKQFNIREFVDVYNDDFVHPLTIEGLKADGWRKLIHFRGENWFEHDEPIVIAPNSVRRVAERRRTIYGRDQRDWWLRKMRFTVETDRGIMVSNTFSSPFRPEGGLIERVKQFKKDVQSEEAGMTTLQRNLDEPRQFPVP